MLSRTADNLYWIARHMERAENIARLLNAQHQALMLPQSELFSHRRWEAVLELFELETQFVRKKNSSVQSDVLNFMVLDEDNESSIYTSLKRARENAKAIRGTLPTELWELINLAWLDFGSVFSSKNWIRDLEKSLEWVKQQSHMFRGVLEGTMPRNEFLYFTKLGMFIERADNTARILDINFLLNQTSLKKLQNEENENLGLFELPRNLSNEVVSDITRDDYYFWITVLRSLSAGEIYSQVYRNEISSKKIAELLIFRQDMPRSLLVCTQNIHKNLLRVSKSQQSTSIRIVGKLCAEIQFEVINDKFVNNIHLFLSSFLERINYLGSIISNEFLVPITPSNESINHLYKITDE